MLGFLKKINARDQICTEIMPYNLDSFSLISDLKDRHNFLFFGLVWVLRHNFQGKNCIQAPGLRLGAIKP